MLFLLSLVVVTVVVLALHVPLKRFPVAFYVLALALTGLYLYANYFGAAVPVWRYLLVYLQRCSIALTLFTLVMFVGVFPENSKIRALFAPLRRELSILGCIFAAGHVVVYATVFIPRLFSGIDATSANLAASLLVSLVLTALLVVLTVTSFVAVRKAMNPKTWKTVQLFAYPFFGLIYLHLVLVLAPSALTGSASAVLSLAVYTALFASYVILRVRRAAYDRQQAVPATAVVR